MEELSALEIREKFIRGELSAREIVDAALKRIDALEPHIDAYLSLLPERAYKKADELDSKRRKGEPLGRLAGVPVAIKDNIHIQGEITTCASKFLSNYRAPFDATATALLEAEGAIPIGKTNLDEFAMGSTTENSAYKTTKNPWDLKCTPGGSSGGSAAAVAARTVPLSFGSDTGGSIRQPAAFCGIVGFKPTYGRVSRNGLVAFASSLDCIGPLATSVADCALAMEIIGSHCSRDATSYLLPNDELLSHLGAGVKGTRIGVPRLFVDQLEGEPRSNFEASLTTLQSLGGEIVDIPLKTLDHSIAIYYILAAAEASTNLARFDGIRYGMRSSRAETLDEVYSLSKDEGFGFEVKRRILLGTFVLSSGYQEAYYRKAQGARGLMIEEFKRAYESCDAIALPTTPTATFELGSIQDPLQLYLADLFTICANLVGLPAISIPSGFSEAGRPFGLQILGPQKGERKVFQVAHAFEEATGYSRARPPLIREGGHAS